MYRMRQWELSIFDYRAGFRHFSVPLLSLSSHTFLIFFFFFLKFSLNNESYSYSFSHWSTFVTLPSCYLKKKPWNAITSFQLTEMRSFISHTFSTLSLESAFGDRWPDGLLIISAFEACMYRTFLGFCSHL